MSEEEKKPEAGAEAGEAKAAEAQAEARQSEARTEEHTVLAEAQQAQEKTEAQAVQAPVGENPAADASKASPAEQAEAAKENAEDARERGVNVNPGEAAETVKELASDAPAAVPAEAGEAKAAPAASAADAAPVDPEREAKVRAAAEARAARAAARAAAEGGAPAGEGAAPAAAEKPARVPRGAAKAEDDGPKEPSPNQPLLDRVVAILKETIGEDAVEGAYINELDGHRPCVVIKNDRWSQAATVFRDHAELKCDYLRNLTGVDQETHLEVVYHLLSLTSKREYGIKVKTDREAPAVPSVTPVWDTANWNEREAYDLFGIDFTGHPDLRRIMMPDDWVGHPLRKDYEPLDPEV